MTSLSLQAATEEELVQLARERNQDAFAELMRRNASTSYRLALSVLKDRQEAEDEVQTSWLKAWLNLPLFQSQSKFSTWFRTIVMNQSLMRLRQSRRARLESISSDEDGSRDWDLPSPGAGPETQLGRQETIERIRAEVQRLPPLFREVIVLRDLEEQPMETIAKQLDISLPAAKSRLARARLMLRNRMEPHMPKNSSSPA